MHRKQVNWAILFVCLATFSSLLSSLHIPTLKSPTVHYYTVIYMKTSNILMPKTLIKYFGLIQCS